MRSGRSVQSNHLSRLLDPTVIGVLGIALLESVSFFARSVLAAIAVGALMLAVAGAIAALSLTRNPGSALPRRFAWAWSAFLVWALVCAVVSGRIWASFSGDATNALGLCSLIALTALSAFGRSRSADFRRVLLSVSPWVVLFECVVMIAQAALHMPMNGSMPNSTYTAALLLLVLPWVYASRLSVLAGSLWWRRAIAAFTVILVAASGARVGASLGLIWLVWQLAHDSQLDVRLRYLVLVALSFAVLGAGFFFARAEIGTTFSIASLGERPLMARSAAAAVLTSPFVGYGPDGYYSGAVATASRWPSSTSSASIVQDPHNLLLWVATSTGLVGLVLLLWTISELISLWRRPGAGWPGVWAVSLILVLAQTAPLPVELWPLLGIVVGASLPRATPPEEHLLSTRYYRRIWLGVLLMCLLFGANELTRWSLEAPSAERSPSMMSWARLVGEVWPFDSRIAYLESLHIGYAIQADPALAVSQLDLVAIERAVRFDSRNPEYALELARTLRSYNAAASKTDAAFREALRRWPTYPVARFEYGAWLSQQGRGADALAQLRVLEAYASGDPQVGVLAHSLRSTLQKP